MIQEFFCVFNCHYQFGVSLMAISIDSKMNGFKGSICTPPILWGACPHALSFLIGCHFCLAALKDIKPSLHSQCRYLLKVGRSILHWSGRPFDSPSQHEGCFPILLTPPFGWPCLPWPSLVSGSIPLLVHYLPASMGIDIIPLPYVCVPQEIFSQITLPLVFTHLQWMLW